MSTPPPTTGDDIDVSVKTKTEGEGGEEQECETADVPKVTKTKFKIFSREDPAPPQVPIKVYSKEETDAWVHAVLSWTKSTATKDGKRKLRYMLAKGIPQSMRSVVWQKLCGSRDLVMSNHGVFQELVNLTSEYEAEIQRDVGRTFPDLELFRDPGGSGQKSLKNVLKAHSIFNREVGYCQGMNFLVAMPLMVMNEEEAFWFTVQLLKKYKLIDLFTHSMSLLKQFLHQLERLIQTTMPQLHEHFAERYIQMSLLCTEWFLTIFTYNFPNATSMRIWDVFLLEGLPFLFKVALSMLKMYHDVLLHLEYDHIVMFMKQLPAKFIDSDRLVEAALELKLDTKLLEKYGEEYRKMVRVKEGGEGADGDGEGSQGQSGFGVAWSWFERLQFGGGNDDDEDVSLIFGF